MEHPTCSSFPPPACPVWVIPSKGGQGQCMVSLQSMSLALPSLFRLGRDGRIPCISCPEAGSGNLSQSVSLDGSLISSQVPIVTDVECEAKMNLSIVESMLCAGGEGRGACQVSTWLLVGLVRLLLHQGDSGGPLTVEEGDGQTLVGVVSHGAPGGCAQVAIQLSKNDILRKTSIYKA